MFTYRRSLWQSPSQPVTGPAINWGAIDTVVIHYTAAANCPEGDDVQRYSSFLRAMQNDYVVNRRYSLGYNVAVSTFGESWEIRGVDMKPAATKGHNDHSWAVLVTVDGQDAASPAAVVEVRRMIAAATARAGRPLKIVGHGELGATSCPGTGVRQQIAAGVFASAPKPPDPVEDDMSTAVLWRHPKYLNVFLIGSGPAINVSPALFNHYTLLKVPYIIEAHDQLLKSCLAQAGLSTADLVAVGA